MFEFSADSNSDITSFCFSINKKMYVAQSVNVALFDGEVPLFHNSNLTVRYICEKGKYYVVAYVATLECQEYGHIGFFLCLHSSSEEIVIGEAYFDNGKWIQNQDVTPFPRRMVGFSLTNQCNLHCGMCWQKERSKKLFLDYQHFASVIDEISQIGTPAIYLWGGEPFLHPDIWRMIRKVKESGLFCIVNTNGVMIRKCISQLIESKLDMLIVSIDGNEEIHDKIRGRNGCFREVTEGIALLRKQQARTPLITINTVITEDNYLYLNELVKLKEHIQANFLEYQFLMFFTDKEKKSYQTAFHNQFAYVPHSVDSYPTHYGDIDIDKLWEYMQSVKDSHTRFFPYVLNTYDSICNYFDNPKKMNNKSCENIRNSMWIDADGNVYPCSNFTDFCVGNIQSESAVKIWNNPKFMAFRKAIDTHLFSICNRCCDMYKTDLFQSKG